MKKLDCAVKIEKYEDCYKEYRGPMRLDIAKVACEDLFPVRIFRARIFSCPELRDELSACQHFLTDTEMENGRHNVFILHLSKLDPDLVNEKLDRVYEKLDCAAKIEKYKDCFKEYRGSVAA